MHPCGECGDRDQELIPSSDRHRAQQYSSPSPSRARFLPELVVCEGFLCVRSLAACARVSHSWRLMAYKSTSIGEHLDFSRAKNVDCDTLAYLLNSQRLRTNGGTKGVRHITFPEYVPPAQLKLRAFDSFTGCITESDIEESDFDDFRKFMGLKTETNVRKIPAHSTLKPGAILDFVSRFRDLDSVTVYHASLREVIPLYARVSVVVDRKAAFHIAVHLSYCAVAAMVPREHEALVANLRTALAPIGNSNSRMFLLDTISDVKAWLPRDLWLPRDGGHNRKRIPDASVRSAPSSRSVRFVHSLKAGGLLKIWLDGQYAKFSFFQDFA